MYFRGHGMSSSVHLVKIKYPIVHYKLIAPVKYMGVACAYGKFMQWDKTIHQQSMTSWFQDNPNDILQMPAKFSMVSNSFSKSDAVDLHVEESNSSHWYHPKTACWIRAAFDVKLLYLEYSGSCVEDVERFWRAGWRISELAMSGLPVWTSTSRILSSMADGKDCWEL